MTQPMDGQVYRASDGQWYRWPNPTPHATEAAAAGVVAPPAPPPSPVPPLTAAPVQTWTPSAALTPIGATSQVSEERFDTRAKLMLGSMAVMLVGLMLPWARLVGLVNGSFSGLDTGSGKVFGLLLLVAAGVVYAHLWRRRGSTTAIGLIVVAGLMLLVAIGAAIDYNENAGIAAMTPGVGIYICALSSIVLGVTATKELTN